jgi:hypothetical protein
MVFVNLIETRQAGLIHVELQGELLDTHRLPNFDPDPF